MNILVSHYTNMHITFKKGEYVGHLEPPIKEILQSSTNPGAATMHSITTERMMTEKVELNTFKPPRHKVKKNIKAKLMALLKEYDFQFA